MVAYDLKLFGIQPVDPGYIYVIEDRGLHKIGRSKYAGTRIKAAKTWLPDMKLIGCKPFWNVSKTETCFHEGFCRNWYLGEWFKFAKSEELQLLTEGFLEFSDTDRDKNSLDFIYWFNSWGMAEFVREAGLQRLTRSKMLRKFTWIPRDKP